MSVTTAVFAPEEQAVNRDASPRGDVRTRFRPGRSGNPGGRPRGRSLTSILREMLDLGTIGGEPLPRGLTVAELLAEVIVRNALKGDFRYVKEVLERTEGRWPTGSRGRTAAR